MKIPTKFIFRGNTDWQPSTLTETETLSMLISMPIICEILDIFWKKKLFVWSVCGSVRNAMGYITDSGSKSMFPCKAGGK